MKHPFMTMKHRPSGTSHRPLCGERRALQHSVKCPWPLRGSSVDRNQHGGDQCVFLPLPGAIANCRARQYRWHAEQSAPLSGRERTSLLALTNESVIGFEVPKLPLATSLVLESSFYQARHELAQYEIVARESWR